MKIVRFMLSPVFMGVLFVLFAISMAAATFIENDYGSEAAYGMVYDTIWFELILLLLAVNLIGQIIGFKLYRKEKFTVFTFHSAFVIILIGAGITRYFGYEGSIHIREGEQENRVFSVAKYLGYTITDNNGNQLAEESVKFNLNSRSADGYKIKTEAGGKNYEIVLARVIPNAEETINESPGGTPIVSLMVAAAGSMGMENLILKKGESADISGYSIGFDSGDSTDILITADGTGFYIASKSGLAELGMMHGDSIPVKENTNAELKPMKIFSVGSIKIIPQEMVNSGILRPAAVDPSREETGRNALIFHVLAGDRPATVTVWNTDNEYASEGSARVDGNLVRISYGSEITELPFALKLNDFILERYPGSNSPSGYKSDVVLIDKTNGTEKPFMIFMNNILKYRGYRFYQSSFDRDEKGTILSVNQDFAGMTVTYTGYLLMVIFIIMSLFNRKSVFYKINPGYWTSPFRKTITAIAFFMALTGLGSLNAQKLVPDKKASENIGKVLVQDQKGRTKPLFTLSNDILRKVTHENDFEGLSSMQVFLGVHLDFDNWQKVRLIRVSNSDLQNKLGVRGNMASFDQIVDLNGGGTYKLSSDVQKAYEKAPGERSKYDKEVMKIDERVNIIYMIYTGQFLRLFPLKAGSHDWGTSDEAMKTAISREDSLYLKNIIPLLDEALRKNNVNDAVRIAESVSEYQKRFSEYDLPSSGKTNAEVFYYKAKIFERLFPYYATVGLIMLIALIASVIRGGKERSLFVRIFSWLLFTGFIFHTLGLALRWYVSGHSPMSNGYESMIFISWVTLLAGFIFSRKSAFALSATAVLGSMTLMVAHLSFMDPEITNLVPVLKSYWLTLHVSIITGSYGFLGLGAILGIINMILMSLSSKKNLQKIVNTIEELTVISYKTLTLGLYFLTIGTFLGAVWANESWGRYWGWDPKETWSLITIVVYSLVIHSRMIPGLKDIYSFNLLSLFAFSSVLMTYFGVNYYLSGLHSYAAGDPVPVPSFVYIAVILLAAVSLMAYFRYSSWSREAEGVSK